MLWQQFWKIPIPEKIKIFAWRLINDGLSTKENKVRRMEVISTCEICGMQAESGHHAVVMCPHAKLLRDAMKEEWDLPDDEKLGDTGLEWLLVFLGELDIDDGARLLLLLWRTWFVRNRSHTVLNHHQSWPP